MTLTDTQHAQLAQEFKRAGFFPMSEHRDLERIIRYYIDFYNKSRDEIGEIIKLSLGEDAVRGLVQ